MYDDKEVENYILNNYGNEVFRYYLKINPKYGAARADFFRYLLIYKEGGVYLDLKSTVTQSLDEVLPKNKNFLLSHWDNGEGGIHGRTGLDLRPELSHIKGGEFLQWCIISVAGHPYLRSVILRVLKKIDDYSIFDGTGWSVTVRVTGPIVYSLAIDEYFTKQEIEDNLFNFARDFGIHYSIYDFTDTGEIRTTCKHNQLIGSLYKDSKEPLILSQNKLKCLLFKLFQKIKRYKQKIKFIYSRIIS